MSLNAGLPCEAGAVRLVALGANVLWRNADLRPMVGAGSGDGEERPAVTFKVAGTGVRMALVAMQA